MKQQSVIKERMNNARRSTGLAFPDVRSGHRRRNSSAPAPTAAPTRIILDLEDAVAPSQKEHARTLIAGAIPHVSRNGADVLVRVNRPWRLLVRDLEAAVIPGVSALMLTKVDSPEHVLARAPRSLTNWKRSDICRPGRLKFIALVETAVGFFRIEQIAKSHPRMVGAQPGIGGFRRRCRHAVGARGVVLSQAAHDIRGARGWHHADGLHRLDRRFPRPGCFPRHRPPLPPAGLHRARVRCIRCRCPC